MTTTDAQAALDVEAFCTGFADAAPAWRRLWLELPVRTPFLSYEWHDAWWRCLGDGSPEILVVPGRALAPFVRRADGTLALSGGELTDLLDVLTPRGDGLDAIARHLAASADRLSLDWVPEASPVVRVLPALLAARGFDVAAAPLVVSPKVTLASSFEEQLAALGKKDRHELRRKLRRLESAGAASFAYVGRDELAGALERFIAWHRGAPGEKREFLTPERERFFREIARVGSAAGWLRIGELRLDGRPIAALLGVEFDATLAAYNSAVDPETIALSPGILLHAFAMRDAITRGLHTYDLLRGAEPYKYDLGARDETLWRVTARRIGAAGESPSPAPHLVRRVT